ncbi:hypothetical protein [Acidisoma sp.]|uniref:hypothetical protein n=1 Tax=Acidisoma sp. TaxID=1872115 RepID=UPI003B009A42
MATIARSNTRTTGRTFGDRLRNLSLRFQASREAARKRNQIMRELSTYSDDELGELGLSRLDIPAVAAGNYRR